MESDSKGNSNMETVKQFINNLADCVYDISAYLNTDPAILIFHSVLITIILFLLAILVTWKDK